MAKQTVVRPSRYHVGTIVRCRVEGCYLHKSPHTVRGSGMEYDRAEVIADSHERIRDGHRCDLLDVVSDVPLKG